MRAATSSGTGPDPVPGSGSFSGSGSGACSMITCALVPLTPNDDTPARRGRPVSGHGVASVRSATPPDSQSTCREGVSTCTVAGRCPCWIAATILITPATPAAAWVWPTFDLIDPSHSGCAASRSRP